MSFFDFKWLLPTDGKHEAGFMKSPESKSVMNWVGDRWSEYTGAAQTQASNEANMKLAETSYQHDLDMWNRTNEYNDPKNQMARLKAAGLSPAMMYGNGASVSVGNASSSMPHYNAPQMKSAPSIDYLGGLASTLNMFQDFRIKSAQADNLETMKEQIQANTDLINMNLNLIPYKIGLTDTQMQKLRLSMPGYQSGGVSYQDGPLWKYTLEGAAENLANIRKKGELLKAQTSLTSSRQSFQDAMNSNAKEVFGYRRDLVKQDLEIKKFYASMKGVGSLLQLLGIVLK